MTEVILAATSGPAKVTVQNLPAVITAPLGEYQAKG